MQYEEITNNYQTTVQQLLRDHPDRTPMNKSQNISIVSPLMRGHPSFKAILIVQKRGPRKGVSLYKQSSLLYYINESATPIFNE